MGHISSKALNQVVKRSSNRVAASLLNVGKLWSNAATELSYENSNITSIRKWRWTSAINRQPSNQHQMSPSSNFSSVKGTQNWEESKALNWIIPQRPLQLMLHQEDCRMERKYQLNGWGNRRYVFQNVNASLTPIFQIDLTNERVVVVSTLKFNKGGPVHCELLIIVSLNWTI